MCIEGSRRRFRVKMNWTESQKKNLARIKKSKQKRIKDEDSARCSRTYKIYDEHKNGMRVNWTRFTTLASSKVGCVGFANLMPH